MFSSTQEILKSVRSLLNEAEPAFYTDEELISFINEGMEDFCMRTKCLTTYFYKTIEEGDLIDGRELALPGGFVALAEGGVTYDGKPLQPISLQLLNEWDRNWRDREGEVTHFYLRGDLLGFYPKPAVGATIGVYGIRLADPLGQSPYPLAGDVRIIPFQRYIRDYALARAWEKKGDFQKAQLKRAEYEQGVYFVENLLNFHRHSITAFVPNSDYVGRRW